MNRFSLLLLLLLLEGCVSITLEQIREQQTNLKEGESLVIIGSRNSLGYEAESPLVQCLDKNTAGIKTIKQQQFIDQMFPWFEPRTAPQTLGQLEELLKQPEVAEQMKTINVRYLVWADISKRDLKEGGSMNCAASVTGALCLGILFWEKDVVYEMTVWDIKSLETAGRLRGDSKGSSVIIGAIIPIPLITFPGYSGCKAVARQLSRFIRNKDPKRKRT